MLLYRIRESNVPTNVYLDFRSSFSSHLHHFHASSPIVFTSASSVSRSKFAAQATIVLSPPEAVKPDMHRSKLHLHPSQQSQPTKIGAAIVTAAAASLSTILRSPITIPTQPRALISPRMIRQKPTINQTNIPIRIPTRLTRQIQHRPSQFLRCTHSLCRNESLRHDAARVLPRFGHGDGHVCWEPCE
jgi:hypothetical protein